MAKKAVASSNNRPDASEDHQNKKSADKIGTKTVLKSKNQDMPKRKKKNDLGFSIYIYRIFKELCNGYTSTLSEELKKDVGKFALSKKTMSILNSFASDILQQLSNEAGRLCQYGKSRDTLSVRDIHTACKLILPGDIKSHAIAEGSKAVARYADYKRNAAAAAST